ncbi:hypothetical protein EDD17DRAFT_1637486 [Pisolithus thermaeus]|nr:hypothetical protein EV401DRAFT_839673 [Pisolithus croceorrhizus]KAI6151322.1 hypothetical protein EDD17DRAFT_1637486 [Pisolithus thermaeus]
MCQSCYRAPLSTSSAFISSSSVGIYFLFSLGLPLTMSRLPQLVFFKSCSISCAGDAFSGSSKKGYRTPLQESGRPCGTRLMSTNRPLISHLLVPYSNKHSCAMPTHHRRVRCGGSPRRLIERHASDLVTVCLRGPLRGCILGSAAGIAATLYDPNTDMI